MAHRARPTSTRASSPCASRTFGQDGPYSPRPGLDRVGIGYGGLLHLTGYPDRPPVRVGVTISDYLTGVFAAQAATAALYARDVHAVGHGRGDRRRALRRGAAHPRVDDRRRTTGSASCAAARATGSRTRAPLDNYPTADGKYVCIVAGSDANFARLCTAMDRPDLLDDPRFARLADRAAHGDEINGIVADWTARSHRGRGRGARASPTTCPVATAYTAADMFADPHFAARGDLVTVDDPVVGPMRQQAPYPRFVGEPTPRPDGRAAARRAHRRGARHDCSASTPTSSTTLRATGASSMTARAGRTTGCSTADPPSRCSAAAAPTCGRHHFPRARRVPVLRRGATSTTSSCRPTGTLWRWTTVTAPPPGYPATGAVRLRRRRAARGPAGDHPARGARRRATRRAADAACASSPLHAADDGDDGRRPGRSRP